MSPTIASAIRSATILLVRSAQAFLDDNCTQMAAAISYYVLFSVFPLLIFAAGLSALLFAGSSVQQDLVNEIMKAVPLDPVEGRKAVTEAVNGAARTRNGVLGLVGLLAMAWSGSSVFGTVRKSLDTVFRDTIRRRPLFQDKLMDLGLALLVGVIFLSSVAATAALRVARARSNGLGAWGDAADSIGVFWDIGSYLLPMLLSFAAFVTVYSVLPSRTRRVADTWPGALVAAPLFDAAKFAFSIYLENFSHYDLVFGSLGAVAAFLFWAYISSGIMLFGAEVSAKSIALRDSEGRSQPAAIPPTPPWPRFLRFVRGLFLKDRSAG